MLLQNTILVVHVFVWDYLYPIKHLYETSQIICMRSVKLFVWYIRNRHKKEKNLYTVIFGANMTMKTSSLTRNFFQSKKAFFTQRYTEKMLVII